MLAIACYGCALRLDSNPNPSHFFVPIDAKHCTSEHLAECLAHFESAAALAEHPGEVAIALWFHDAIYDPRRSDNEAASAQWAARELGAAAVAADVIARVRQIILVTCHDAQPGSADERLMVDIDLGMLGADAARFAQYDAQVAAEYAWVPRWLYRRKRRAVLQAFLAQRAIYATPVFAQRFEAAARRNLAAAVASLA